MTLRQTQQFSTNAAGGATVSWSVDGIAGGNSSVGTISASGVYTPASSGPGNHTIKAVNTANTALSVSAQVYVTDLTGVYTYHNDLSRTGQNQHEYALNIATVTGGGFGKLWSCPLDGAVVSAQPLYVANLAIGGGTHNVLYVVTQGDTVYAFDADSGSCTPYWTRSFVNGTTITPTSSADEGCGDTYKVPGSAPPAGVYGITGTPVIDPSTSRMYLVAATTESGTHLQRLHALDLATGSDVQTPAVINATVNGTADGGTTVSFNSLYQNQRSGLALVNGGIVIAWGAHCDNTAWPWHGWLMRYNAALTQTATFITTPNGLEGGIWMSGDAPAVDAEGRMFLSTGNGTFTDTGNGSDTRTASGNGEVPVPTNPANNSLSMSFLDLDPTSLTVTDLYTPSGYSAWSNNDLDISAGGNIVLPDGSGPVATPNLLLGTDKQGHVWLLNRDVASGGLSGYLSTGDRAVQFLTLSAALLALPTPVQQQTIHASPSYFNGTIYAGLTGVGIVALPIGSTGLLPTDPANPGYALPSSTSSEVYWYPSPSPEISSTGLNNGIVWALDNNANATDNGSNPTLGPAILRAYDANNLGTTLFDSSRSSANTAGNASKFISPIIANGHVYVVGNNSLTVYGLLP